MSGDSRKRRIILVAGGWSPEREISLSGAEGIARALRGRGHAVTPYDLSNGLDTLVDVAAGHDAAFLNLHGQPGEDGLVQALLERVGCPYQGSDPAGSFLALNKAAAKTLFRRAGLRVPEGVFLPRRPQAGWTPDLRFPLFVKSNTGGSSLHLFRARDGAELKTALDALFGEGQEVLIEEMATGREVTCGVLDVGEKGPEALPPVLIVPRREFFDYHDKYAADGAAELCPAPLPGEVLERVRRTAVAAHRCLGLAGCSRADFILTPDNDLYLLEVNTLPGMTAASLVPKEAAALGMDFGELLEILLEDAIRRHGVSRV